MSYENLTPPVPGPPPPAAPRPRGLVCPGCAGRRFSVDRTEAHPGRIVRTRRCLDCGRRFRTAERVESVTA